MAFNGGSFLAFPLLGWFLVELATAELGENASFFTGTLEATQCSVEILIFFYANTRHTNIVTRANTKKPGTGAGTEPHMISAQMTICNAISGLRYDAPLMLILGLETSCDETGVALYDSERGLLGEALHSQVDLHAVYGGVVPEIASRDHLRRLLPLIRQVLGEAGVDRPDAIAYTAGPGLVGALMVGGGMAAGLGLAWQCPVIPIHHMEGHLVAPMLEEHPPAYPFLALLVSGGHTLLVWVAEPGSYEIMGSTLDDAVGEAFDKTAKLLGLGYPGGPALAQLAETGSDRAWTFPRPMIHRDGFDFSFSGLKTAVMLKVREAESLDSVKADIAASFQRAVVDTLIARTLKAARHKEAQRIVVAGGVGANRLLRAELTAQFAGEVFYPRLRFCTDNGAMIAVAGAMRLTDAEKPATIRALARWSLESLERPATQKTGDVNADQHSP